MLDRIRDKRRHLIVGFTFFTYLLITVPSGLEAWLSLIERYSSEDNAFVLDLAWYPIGLLILGLAILIVGTWWIRAKDKIKGTEPTPEATTLPETLPTEIGTQSFPPTFLDVSAAELVGIYKGRTTAQVKPLIDAHIGNMIQIRGSVFDISESSDGTYFVILREEPSDMSSPSIMAYFGEEMAEAIRSLSIDQGITVLGKIDDIDRSRIRLESCLLLADVSAADLFGIYKGRTTVQAKPLVDAHIGNMIQIRGSVFDISESSDGTYFVSLQEEPSDISSSSIMAYFGEESAVAIQFLAIGQSITVLGKIDDIDRSRIRLESCLLGRGLYG